VRSYERLTIFAATLLAAGGLRLLGNARGDLKSIPTAEAVDRIRAQVLGIEAPRKSERSIAA